LNGQTLLAAAHETSARVDVANLPIQDVLAIAGRRDIDAAGILGAEATLSGTLADPHAAGTFTVANGKFESETFDRLQASVNYSSRLIDVPDLMLAAGPGVIRASVNFVHPPNDLREGQLHFHVDSKSLQLARLQMVQRRRPGLTGTLKLTADGTAALRRAGTPRVLFSRLNANLSATDLNLNRKALGDVSATAATRGSDLIFHLKSNLGGAEIRGDGTVQLAGDYPAKAQFSFSDVKYSELQPVIGAVLRPGVDASMKGRADLAGPAARPEDLGGTLRLSRLEMHSFPVQGGPTMRRNISVNNAGPVVVTLNQSVVEIRSAHLVGPYVDLTLTGTAQTAGAKTLNLRADGNMRLELVEAFEPNVFASGSAVLHASVQGNISKPDVNGQLTLRDASLNLMDVPNGLSDANGTIVFNGTSAMVENVTGTTGGGKLTLSGFVGYGGPELQFRLTAAARRVRIQATPNVSGAVNANLDLSGSTNNSLLSGNVTILDAALVSHTDIGSVLSETAAPAKAPVAGGPLNAMRLDVRVRTVPDIQVRTSLTENLALDAQVTVRGTAAHPGMLGRVSITEGEVVFFGSKYTVDQGSVAFCNPQDIEPILNIDLSTTVKGVDVALNVTGPVDRIKLSYHSDPPLQFSDLVSLLATGRVPTTDPVLAAHQPATPEQNLEQKGASTVLGQAVANPVSGRLQRLFGVTKLKIDPQITGAANTPQARLTLQQQITKDLTFTYIQDVTQSNPQIIQVEWTIDPAWSAIAQRDVSGEFALDFFYKKRFR
jgi:translocation and assembly module TamB